MVALHGCSGARQWAIATGSGPLPPPLAVAVAVAAAVVLVAIDAKTIVFACRRCRHCPASPSWPSLLLVAFTAVRLVTSKTLMAS